MTLSFNNVTPAPFAGVTDLKTDLWQKEFTFQSGRRYQLLAPSGKGKSTFIHYLYGLRFDYSGDVIIDLSAAKSLKADQWSDLRREKLSIVFQDLRLFLHLSALENISVKSALYNTDNKEKIKWMAHELQISHVLNKPAKTLSYGERQRVAIIRSLLQPFKWILMDEPFSHLDEENTIRSASLIEKELLARQAGMIVTSLNADLYFKYDQTVKI